MDGADGWLTIGQMAELNNVTKKTLLTYERHGLIEPARTNAETGYRYYALEQSSLIDMIHQLQLVGFSLAEIGTVMADRDIDHLRALLEEKDAELAERMEQLALSRGTAARLMRTCDIYEEQPVCGVPTLEWVGERRILFFPVEPYRLDQRRATDPPELNAWERSLRQVKGRFVAEGLPQQLFCNAGAYIPRENLRAGDLTVTGAYVFDDVGIDSPRARAWKPGHYLTIACNGIFAPDGTHAEKVYLERLLAIAREEGYTLIGGYHSEIIAETPLFHFHGRDMMLKLRVPVYAERPEESPYFKAASEPALKQM